MPLNLSGFNKASQKTAEQWRKGAETERIDRGNREIGQFARQIANKQTGGMAADRNLQRRYADQQAQRGMRGGGAQQTANQMSTREMKLPGGTRKTPEQYRAEIQSSFRQANPQGVTGWGTGPASAPWRGDQRPLVDTRAAGGGEPMVQSRGAVSPAFHEPPAPPGGQGSAWNPPTEVERLEPFQIAGRTEPPAGPWPGAGWNPGDWEDDDAINSYMAMMRNPDLDRATQEAIAQGTLGYNYDVLNEDRLSRAFDRYMSGEQFQHLKEQDIFGRGMERRAAGQRDVELSQTGAYQTALAQTGQFEAETGRYGAETERRLGEAQHGLQRDQLAQQGEQFYATLNQENQQFYDSLDFRREELLSQEGLARQSNRIQEEYNQGRLSNEQAKIALEKLQHEASVAQFDEQMAWEKESGRRELGIREEDVRGQLALGGRRADIDQQIANTQERVQTGELSVKEGTLALEQLERQRRYEMDLEAQQFQQRRRALEFQQQQQLAREQAAMAAFGRFQAPTARVSRSWR